MPYRASNIAPNNPEQVTMWKNIPWRLVAVMVGVLVAAFLAVGQAITFAWLSAFPERAAQLSELETKFWAYIALAVVLVIVDIGLLVRLIRQVRGRKAALS